ncbi:MAG: bifunctional diguanylate cyclase/phosphodiesterase, partial [Alphaproteobacteria bacterium]|nr:bifunctional diguanylate cyclase/phosphodiesterase [Alphaproteobacteria bacterium]
AEISSLFDLMSEEDRNFYKKKIMQLGETVGGQYEFEVELHNLVGQQCHLFCTVEFKYEDGRLSSINGAIQDITERQRAEEIIQYLEMHDPLTTLPNRNSFQEQMLGFLADARLDVEQLAVMVIDLDRFKDVNDTHGQAVADLFLTEVGVRLSDQISQYESLFRVGGDEFAIVCRGIDDMNDVAEKAEEILNVVNQEFRYFDESISLTASVGIAIFPQDADDVDSLLRCADLALQRSKQTIGSTYHFYDAEMSKIFHRRKEQEIRLHHAINESQFELHYQPKIDLRNNGFVGVEALVRWNDPELGTVKPDEFIPLAEETGQIGKLGRWIIQEACGAADRLRKELGFDVPIAINVSVEQIKCPNLSEFIKKTMDEHGIGPELLEIEITETSFLEDISLTGATLADLRKMNLDIALDDFGTGYSSLTHLKNMLATSLKIDRSFIQNIMTEPSDSHIADMIINVAHRLDMRVVAEGIEEQAQVEKLIDLNCDIGQGYYFSRPLPERELVKWYHAFKG